MLNNQRVSPTEHHKNGVLNSEHLAQSANMSSCVTTSANLPRTESATTKINANIVN